MTNIIEKDLADSGVDRRTAAERDRDDVTYFIDRVGVRDAIKICMEKLQQKDGFNVDDCTSTQLTKAHLMTILQNAGRRRGKIIHVLQTARVSSE